VLKHGHRDVLQLDVAANLPRLVFAKYLVWISAMTESLQILSCLRFMITFASHSTLTTDTESRVLLIAHCWPIIVALNHRLNVTDDVIKSRPSLLKVL
jgi:hypothetical protein